MEEENDFKLEPQDRLELSNTAKGLLQFSVKIHAKMDSKEAIDAMIERHEYLIKKLREKYPNLIWNEGQKTE